MKSTTTTYIYTVGITTMVDTEPFGAVWKTIKSIHDATGLPIDRKTIKVETREEEFSESGVFTLRK